ncbi:MAG: hypothetical protein DMG32_26760 [Acidobacteria bacterium]|nr:MAG: hypothetical protein DMG32_26760 [Acidobacteriota bacterium]
MRFLWAGLLLMIAVSPSLAQSKPQSETMKVKVEGTELDQRQLLQKMNEHGADHRMRFEASDGGFDYRIVFETSQGQDAVKVAFMLAGIVSIVLGLFSALSTDKAPEFEIAVRRSTVSPSATCSGAGRKRTESSRKMTQERRLVADFEAVYLGAPTPHF